MNPRTIATDSPDVSAQCREAEPDVTGPRGMADPMALLHDTRASYPTEWVDMPPKLNRAQRRAYRRNGR